MKKEIEKINEIKKSKRDIIGIRKTSSYIRKELFIILKEILLLYSLRCLSNNTFLLTYFSNSKYMNFMDCKN